MNHYDPIPDPPADNSAACNEADRINDAIWQKPLDDLTARAIRLAEQKATLRIALINVHAYLKVAGMFSDNESARIAADAVARTLEETK